MKSSPAGQATSLASNPENRFSVYAESGRHENHPRFRIGFPEVAIIAVSGRTNSGTILSVAENLAAVGVLQKPFTAEELIAAVAKALRERSPAHEARAAAALEHDDVTNPGDPCVKQVALGHLHADIPPDER